MNWDRTSAIAEILSSVAILVTLVYLTIEINQNAEATRADTRQAILQSDQEFLRLFIDDPELHLMWYKPQLNDVEKVRLSYFLITHMRMRESNWFQYLSGTLDARTWHSYRATIVVVLSAPNTRTWWRNYGVKLLFDPDFIALVDDLLADQPVTDKSHHLSIYQ